MVTKLVDAVVSVCKLVARYPALTAGVFNVVIVISSYLGFHLTTGQLTTVAGITATVFGVLVHAGVIPVSKVANVKAGILTTVPPVVAVTSAESNAKPVTEVPGTSVSPTPAAPVAAHSD